jgi:translation initiation factor 2B subunit (eIF-2B alpha/beta/delta family)
VIYVLWYKTIFGAKILIEAYDDESKANDAKVRKNNEVPDGYFDVTPLDLIK